MKSGEERVKEALEFLIHRLDEAGENVRPEVESIINGFGVKIGQTAYVVVSERDTDSILRSSGPIVFETNLEEATMQEAMRKASSLGSRYGKKYIAVLTIIEEVK